MDARFTCGRVNKITTKVKKNNFKLIQYKCLIILIFRSEVAKRLDKKCYGLIFGFNTFIAVCINTIIIYGVIQGHFIKINIAQQVIYKYNNIRYILDR